MSSYDMNGMFVYNDVRYGLHAYLLIDDDGFFETTVHDPLYSSHYHLFGKMMQEETYQAIQMVRSPNEDQRDGLFFSLQTATLEDEVMRFFGGWHVLPEEKSRMFQFPLPWREAELEAFYQYTKEFEPQGIVGFYLLERDQSKYL